MVITATREDKPQKLRLDSRRIRSKLILRGYSLRSWAKSLGVSGPLVSMLISGAKPGKSGQSVVIKRKLEELAR
jgi:predicted transcriptional regulator